MIDNINIFEKYIKNISTEDNKFINISIIKRNKDTNNGNGIIKTYYITSYDSFLKVKEDIINICNATKSRAYIIISPKSYDKLIKEVNLVIAMRMQSNNSFKLNRIVDSAASNINGDFKYFILDIDYNVDNQSKDEYNNVLKYIKDNNYKIYEEYVPTQNGIHIITEPFNIDEFKKIFPNIEIKRNWYSLLYKY